MKTILLLVLIGLLAPSSFLSAEVVSEETIDIQTREIAKTLRCAVCQTESVWESNAELARQMREVIRERVAQGQSAQEIREYFLGRYGDYILLEPRKQGLNWLIWAGPFIVLTIGGALLFRRIRRWVAQTQSGQTVEVQSIDDVQRKRIDQEFRSLNE